MDCGKTRGTGQDELFAGYACADITPPLPFPMAGIAGPKERLAAGVRDPLRATCVRLRQGKTEAAILLLDILIIDGALMADLREIAQSAGCGNLLAVASHTHSGPGGTVDGRGTRFFMGRYREDIRRNLLATVENLLGGARADELPVSSVRHGAADVPGMTMNRRMRGGTVDDRVLALVVERRGGSPVLLGCASGHPVVVAFMKPELASADWPGEVRRRFEADGFLPLLLPGALGGLNVLFPEMPTAMEDHLDLIARNATDGLRRAISGAVSTSLRLRFSEEDVSFRRAWPPYSGGPPNLAMRAALSSLLGSFYSRFVAPPEVSVPISVVGIGEAAVTGMPADFGVVATRTLRDRLSAAGCACPLVASHSNGYVGYVHLPDELDYRPGNEPGFLTYENAMAWYGRDAGTKLIDAACRQYESIRS